MRGCIALFLVLCLSTPLVKAQHTAITSDTLPQLDILNRISFEEGAGKVLGDLAFNYTDDLLATRIEVERKIQIWEPDTGSLAGELTSTTPFIDAEIGNLNNWLISVTGDCHVVIWDLATMTAIKELRNEQGKIALDLKINSNDSHIFLSEFQKEPYNGELIVWNVISEELTSLSFSKGIIDFAVSPDAKTLAVLAKTNEITVWDTENYNLLNSIHPEQEVFHITYSIDSEKIIASYQPTSGIIWNLATNETKILPDLHYDDFVSAGYVTLIPQTINSKVYAVDVITGEQMAPIPFLQPGERTNDYPLMFSRDNSLFLSVDRLTGRGIVMFGMNTDRVWFKDRVFKEALSPNSYYFAVYDLFEREVSIMGIKSTTQLRSNKDSKSGMG